MDDVQQTLEYLGQHGDVSFLYWIVGATVALLVLFLVARLLRNIASYRVKQVREFGMDFDAVSSMIDKGLLTPEEAKRVRAVLARRFKEIDDKRTAPPQDAIAPDLAQHLPGPPGLTPPPSVPPLKEGKAPVTQPSGASPDAARPRPQSPAHPRPSSVIEAAINSEPPAGDEILPPDIVDMYKAGMISDDELDALRNFYAQRKK